MFNIQSFLDAIQSGSQLIPELTRCVFDYYYTTVKFFSTDEAFAAIIANDQVMTWGHADYGGDSRAVQAELKQDVDTIYSTDRAFAAKMRDGTVVTWNMLIMVEIAVPCEQS